MIIEPAARPVGSPVPASPPADGSLGYGPPASDPPTSGPPPSGPPPSGPPPSGPPPAGPPAEVLAAPEVEERLANSPFWMSDEERAAAEATQPLPAPRPRRPAANPLSALLCLIVLSLAAAFFGWVSAEPFWLAVGHGDRGYAVTTSCHGSGLTQRCVGEFATDGFSAGPVTLLGIAGDGRRPGAVSSARMVGPGSDQAYTAGPGPLMHLRWGLGFLLVLLCGHGIAATTGARRLPSRPARRGATIASFLGPLLLLGGFLVAAY
ncbi:hypothetical protein SAMN05421541_111437 [Actinoplanes philippinensis]|uniref:Uncharacterized protein n=2 Tax=Actinoplanes philippinensis TaxID=35752 RepID=A0A1I2J8N6_9ACTN|nr:hypothetical protein SAMN05421541_111437 [Actinoplanes philippinensis]